MSVIPFWLFFHQIFFTRFFSEVFTIILSASETFDTREELVSKMYEHLMWAMILNKAKVSATEVSSNSLYQVRFVAEAD